MTNLTSIEKIKFEKLFEMRGGYVLDFSDRTFREFIIENVDRDIYIDKYDIKGTSKANRLRTFWDIEPASTVGKLLNVLLEYWKTRKLISGETIPHGEQEIYDNCKKIAGELISREKVDSIDALKPIVNDINFQRLTESIKESIQKNEPQIALDRLHTFVIKHIRELCNRHSITYDKKIPLHGLFGSYVKFLKQKDLIESEMTEKILKSSITVLEAFNDVRNNHSLAHDNPILNYHESILIFNNISNTLRFIESVEDRISEKAEEKRKVEVSWEDIPYSEEEINAAGDAWIQSQIDLQRGK